MSAVAVGDSASNGVTCPTCGNQQSRTKFCTQCGNALPAGEVIDHVPGLQAAAGAAPGGAAPFGVERIHSSYRLPHVAALGHARTMHWVGAHGGAGEDTLGRAIAGTVPAGHGWPIVSADYRLAPVPVPVMLVARTNMRGLLAAQHALRDWASGGVRPLHFYGLVMIGDAPGVLPKPLKDFKKLVEGGAPQVFDVPFLPELRMGEDPLNVRHPSLNLLRSVVAGIVNSTTN